MYIIYILVENLPQENKKQNKKNKANRKYLNKGINNRHERVKSSQISHKDNIRKDKSIEGKQDKNKQIKNIHSNNVKMIKKHIEIKNPGVRLYEQNKEHISKKVKKMKEKLEEEKKLEDLKLTFKPKINEYSRKLVGDNYNGIKVENRLINFGKIYNEKNKSKQNIKDDGINTSNLNKHIKNLSDNIRTKKRKKNLTPINNLNYIKKSKINLDKVKTENNSKNKTKPKKSKHNLTPDKNLYDYLYLESKIRKQRRDDAIQKNLDLTCPFKPKLNDSFNKNIKNNDINVFDRLYNAKNENKKLATEMKLRKKFNYYTEDNKSDYLSKTPPKKYKNVISENNNIKNRNSNEDDNSYINSINKTIDNENNDKSYFNNENKKNYFKKSYITILKAKYIKLVELFNSLDSDKDGIICYKKIKLSNIEPEKLISLTPLFYDIQYKGMKIDFQKFCEIIQNLN